MEPPSSPSPYRALFCKPAMCLGPLAISSAPALHEQDVLESGGVSDPAMKDDDDFVAAVVIHLTTTAPKIQARDTSSSEEIARETLHLMIRLPRAADTSELASYARRLEKNILFIQKCLSCRLYPSKLVVPQLCQSMLSNSVPFYSDWDIENMRADPCSFLLELFLVGILVVVFMYRRKVGDKVTLPDPE